MENEIYIVDFLGLNMQIKNNFFGLPTFVDNGLEKEFESLKKDSSYLKEILSLFFEVVGYLNSLYLFSISSERYFIIVSLVLLVLTLIIKFYLIYTIKQEKDINSLYNQIEVLLSFMNLCFNFIALGFICSLEENQTPKTLELITTNLNLLIFQYFFVNFLMFLKLEANFILSISYFFLIILTLFFSKIYSINILNIIYISGLCLVTNLTFFWIKKEYSINERRLFAENKKFRDNSILFSGIINEMNLFHVQIKNKSKTFMNKAFSNFLIDYSVTEDQVKSHNLSTKKKYSDENEMKFNKSTKDKNLKIMSNINSFFRELKFYENNSENNNLNMNNKDESSDIMEINSLTMSPLKSNLITFALY